MVAGGRELIDTLWNVNDSFSNLPPFNRYSELIDTLWNVNGGLSAETKKVWKN